MGAWLGLSIVKLSLKVCSKACVLPSPAKMSTERVDTQIGKLWDRGVLRTRFKSLTIAEEKSTMSRAHFPIADPMEKKASEICGSVIRDERVGFLCWYCDANLIEKGAEQVFVGINPGGGSADDILDLQEGNLEKPYTISGWNIWLDGEHHAYKQAVCRLFKIMQGPGWKQKLRSTACFNVFPVRTMEWKALVREYKLWDPLAEWFQSVLVEIKPKRVICSGNDNSLGPWAAIKKQFKTDRIFDAVPLWSNYKLKGCRIKYGRQTGTKVLGFPNFGRAKMGPILVEETTKLVKTRLWTCE